MRKKSVPFYSRYSEYVDHHGSSEFDRCFFKALITRLTENFGEKECKNILKNLGSKKIIIKNRKSFFRVYNGIQEISSKIFNDCKNEFEFFSRASMEYNKELLEGSDYIPLMAFLIYVTFFVYKNKKGDNYTFILLRQFLAGLFIDTKTNPFTIEILDEKLFMSIIKQLNLEVSFIKYVQTVCTCLSLLEDILNSKHLTSPRITYLKSIYNNVKLNQVSYLSSIFNLTNKETKEVVKEVDLSIDSSARDNALFYLKNKSKFWREDLESIKLELERISKECTLKTYYSQHDISEQLHLKGGMKRSLITKLGIQTKFVPVESCKDLLSSCSSIIEINCDKIKNLDSLDILMSQAFKISIINRKKLFNNQYPPRIVLKNVNKFSEEAIKEIYNKKDKLSSLYNKDILVQIEFDPKVARTKAGDSYPTHIRVISDIHCDINASKGYYFNFGNDFVLNCGDTSGDCVTTANWVKSNMRKGLFIHGNHLGYNQAFPELNGPQNLEKYNSYIHRDNTQGGQSRYLTSNFMTGDVLYMEKSMQEFNGVYFLGACMYTNFRLYGEDKDKDCSNISQKQLNDYRYVYKYYECDYLQDVNNKWKKVEISNPRVEPIRWYIYVNYFIDTILTFKEKLIKLGNKPVVIMTHFAPSIHSIAPRYKNDPLSASFASDLKYFFENFPNIRLWCHGHVHHENDYILNNTRVVSCPWGYYNENNFFQDEYGKRISFEDIKSKKSWESILSKEIEKGDVKIYKTLSIDNN